MPLLDKEEIVHGNITVRSDINVSIILAHAKVDDMCHKSYASFIITPTLANKA